MTWTLIEVSAANGIHAFAVATDDRGIAIKRVLKELSPQLAHDIASIVATLKTEPLVPDEGLPQLKL